MKKYLINLTRLEGEGSDYLDDYLQDPNGPIRLFDEVFDIRVGSIECRVARVIEVITYIDNNTKVAENVLIHFLGHGAPYGIECICYKDLAKYLKPLSNKCSLYINLMNTCNSAGLVQYDCYKTLMYTEEVTTDVYTPFRIYDQVRDLNDEWEFNKFVRVFEAPQLKICVR